MNSTSSRHAHQLSSSSSDPRDGIAALRNNSTNTNNIAEIRNIGMEENEDDALDYDELAEFSNPVQSVDMYKGLNYYTSGLLSSSEARTEEDSNETSAGDQQQQQRYEEVEEEEEKEEDDKKNDLESGACVNAVVAVTAACVNGNDRSEDEDVSKNTSARSMPCFNTSSTSSSPPVPRTDLLHHRAARAPALPQGPQLREAGGTGGRSERSDSSGQRGRRRRGEGEMSNDSAVTNGDTQGERSRTRFKPPDLAKATATAVATASPSFSPPAKPLLIDELDSELLDVIKAYYQRKQTGGTPPAATTTTTASAMTGTSASHANPAPLSPFPAAVSTSDPLIPQNSYASLPQSLRQQQQSGPHDAFSSGAAVVAASSVVFSRPAGSAATRAAPAVASANSSSTTSGLLGGVGDGAYTTTAATRHVGSSTAISNPIAAAIGGGGGGGSGTLFNVLSASSRHHPSRLTASSSGHGGYTGMPTATTSPPLLASTGSALYAGAAAAALPSSSSAAVPASAYALSANLRDGAGRMATNNINRNAAVTNQDILTSSIRHNQHPQQQLQQYSRSMRVIGTSDSSARPNNGGSGSGASLSTLPPFSSTSFVRAYVSDISLNLEPAILVSGLAAALNMVVVYFLQHHVLDTRDHLGLFLIGSYLVFSSYYMVYHFLERFSSSFRRIASQDKKFYIIGNLLKAGILISITPFAFYHLVKIIIFDEWESNILRNLGCIYAIPDFISMIIVKRMRWSTWTHHACVVIFNYFSILNDYKKENVCRCVVVYAAFSSFAYCVNVLLASRFLGVSVSAARVLSFAALVVYVLCCAVNWMWQVYYLRRLIKSDNDHWTVYVYMFLICLVMWDDVILNRWLLHHARNTAFAASQQLQQRRMQQQQQQQR